MILNDALKIYLGDRQVDKFYLGGTAPEITEYIPCGGNTTYTGNTGFPAIYSVILGNDTGTVSLSYDAQGIPDRFVVEFDGLTVIDTGYRGDTFFQTQLNDFFGTFTPIVGTGEGVATFNKNTSTPTATVKVFAPLQGTAWDFTLTCPVTSSNPVPDSIYNSLGNYYTNYNNSGKDVYVSTGYPISAIFDKSPGYDIVTTENILSALDKWGQVLEGSTFNSRTEGTTIFTGDTFTSNPLQGVLNTSISIYISAFYADSGDLQNALGYAGVSLRRRASEQGTDQYNIPYNSFMAFNTYWADTVDYLTPLNKNNFYYTVLHELGHALGLGTNWHNLGTSLFQSFIVGAGDNTPNPLNLGLSANFFYTTQTDPSRTNTDIGKLTVLDDINGYIGDADEIFAFNGFSTVDSISKAVSAYNVLFGTNLTAIPVENGGGFGSIGSHWEEGYDTQSATWGTNNRSYYGNTAPGAPGLEDELMSPLSEAFRDTPLSIISIGAAQDLGYTVNYQYADTYLPRTFNVYEAGTTTGLRIGWHGSTTPANPVMGYFSRPISLKRGLTYTFNLFTGPSYPIYIVTVQGQTGSPPISRVTTGVSGDGSGTGILTWNIPVDQTTGTYYLQTGIQPSMSASMVLN